MKPIEFKEQTKVLQKPQGWTDKQCSPLAVFNDGKLNISCWVGDLRDRLRFIITGKIWLQVYSGTTQPPVSLTTKYPFIINKKKGEL